MRIDRPSPVELVLWDVVGEHLAEAGFLLERWQKASVAPHYTVSEVAARIEARLEAHLDGLRVGGEPVAERLLHPLLEDDAEPLLTTVASLVLLDADRSADRFTPLRALRNAADPQRQAIALALKLSGARFIDQGLLSEFQASKDPETRATLLDIMASRQLDPGKGLLECLDSGHGSLVLAALRVAGRGRRRDLVDHCERLLFDDDRAIREAAIEGSLIMGSQQAWRECLALARDPRPSAVALQLVASLGSRKDHRLLHARLDDSSSLAATIRALGFTGSVQSGDLCIPYLSHDDERIAKLAAEAIAAIAGVDLFAAELKLEAAEGDVGAPPLSQDALDADLVPDCVDQLPLVDAGAMRSLWSQVRATISETQRYVEGQPWSPGALVRALRVAPMRRRHSYARELLVKSGAARRVDTERFTRLQIRQLGELDGLAPRDFANTVGGGW